MIYDLIKYTPMYVSAFWAIILLSSWNTKNLSKSFLGIFMFIAFLLYMSHAIYFQEYFGIYKYFDLVYTFCSLTVYPLYFWYIKLLTVENKLVSKNLLLLLPAIIISLSTAVLNLLMSEKEALDFIKIVYYNQDGQLGKLGKIQQYNFYFSRLIFAIQVFIFLIPGIKLVNKYNQRVANFYSDIEGRSIVWVNLLLVSFVATSVMSIVFNFIGRNTFTESSVLLLIPSAIFSTLIFFIGYQGSLQRYTVADLLIDEKDTAKLKGKKQSFEKLKTKLITLFEQDEVYTNPDLKITTVAIKLNTNRTYLSNLINTEFSCTFSDFVGRFRIEKAKKIIVADSDQKYSLDSIAETVGFGSTSSFIRVFKKEEGITPGNFKLKNGT